MWLTKCSIAFLFLRLSPDSLHIIASKTLLVLSTVFMVISLLMTTVRCDMSHPWIFVGDDSCPNLV